MFGAMLGEFSKLFAIQCQHEFNPFNYPQGSKPYAGTAKLQRAEAIKDALRLAWHRFQSILALRRQCLEFERAKAGQRLDCPGAPAWFIFDQSGSCTLSA